MNIFVKTSEMNWWPPGKSWLSLYCSLLQWNRRLAWHYWKNNVPKRSTGTILGPVLASPNSNIYIYIYIHIYIHVYIYVYTYIYIYIYIYVRGSSPLTPLHEGGRTFEVPCTGVAQVAPVARNRAGHIYHRFMVAEPGYPGETIRDRWGPLRVQAPGGP